MNGMVCSSLNLGNEENWETRLDMIPTPSGRAKCVLHPTLAQGWIANIGTGRYKTCSESLEIRSLLSDTR